MRILAIGAHFDDVELGCGGTLLKHRDNGDELHILVVTHSEYENKVKKHLRRREAAMAEGLQSAARLGARLHTMNLPTTTLTSSEAFVLQISEYVDAVAPDRVYTHRPEDTHGDHAAVGHASLRACRRCNDIFLYRSNWFTIDAPDYDNFFVDITAHLEEKKELIGYFVSELEQVGDEWINFVEQQNKSAGYKIGVGFAETFRTIKMVW